MGAVNAKKWSNVVFAALFVIALLLFSRILAPLWVPVLLGAFIVVLCHPLQDFLRAALRGHRSLAAGLSTLAVFLLLVVPLLAVAWVVGRELLGLVDTTRVFLARPDWREVLLARLPAPLARAMPADATLFSNERTLLATLSGSGDVLRALLGAGTDLAISLFLMAVSTYYFFLDGRRLLAEGARLLPLDRRYLLAFFKEFRGVSHALIYGNSLSAVVQAVVALVGFWLAGVPHAGVWAAALGVVALLPIGATVLVWAPVGLALFAVDRTPAGIFVLAWGLLAVGGIDSVLRPKLCGSKMALHPLLVFLSMFGGLAVFGLAGLLLGPLVASLFMAMLRIYRRDFLAPEELVGEAAQP